jgi:hypothetical protein
VHRGSPNLRGESVNQQKGCQSGDDNKVSQQQHIRTEVGNRTAPGEAGWAEEQMVDDVQPGKITIRSGHDGGSHIGVAPGANRSVQGLAGAGV